MAYCNEILVRRHGQLALFRPSPVSDVVNKPVRACVMGFNLVAQRTENLAGLPLLKLQHLLGVLCGHPACQNGMPGKYKRQPSAASAQITVQMMPSSLLAGTQLY